MECVNMICCLMRHLVVIALSLVLSTSKVEAAATGIKHYVFSMNHFRATAFEYSLDKKNWVAKTNTLLLLVTPKCEKEYLEKYKMTPVHLPPMSALAYYKYDYETFPKGIWYQKTGEDQLYALYKPDRCPTAVHIKKGALMNDYESWSTRNNENFEKWLWNELKVDVFFGNFMKPTVVVAFEGPGPSVYGVDLKQASGREFNTYIGKTLIAYIKGSKDKDVVHVQIVNSSMLTTQSTTKWQAPIIGKFKDIQKRIPGDRLDAEAAADRSNRFLQFSYIRSYKQPLLLGHMTNTGYHIVEMDDLPYSHIIEYISQEELKAGSAESRILSVDLSSIDENTSKYSFILSPTTKNPTKDLQKLKVLPLNDTLAKRLGRYLKKFVEEWVDIDVELVKMEEIHFYEEGMYLNDHVTKASEAFTALVVIEKEEDGKEPIEFEAVNFFDGSRHIISLTPGSICLLESAVLITSLKQPLLKGQYLTVLRAKFKPVIEWPWQDSKDEMRIGMDPRFMIHEPLNSFEKKIKTGFKPAVIDMSGWREMKQTHLPIEEAIDEDEFDYHKSVFVNQMRGDGDTHAKEEL